MNYAGLPFQTRIHIGDVNLTRADGKGLQDGMVELKPRSVIEKSLLPLNKIVEEIQNIL
jgi:hypothetical protein